MAKSKSRKTDPIDKKSEVEDNPDPGIDRDVPGFPHHPSTINDIKKKKPVKKGSATKKK